MSKRALGADPEFFLVKGNSTKATSIHLLDDFEVGGYNVGDDNGVCKYSTLKTDGWAVELNTTQGVQCRDYLIPSMAGTLKAFYKKHKGWSLSAIPVMELTKPSVSGDLPLGVNEFGCLPDIDAYALAEKTPFRSDYHDRFRYAGGHLHLAKNIHEKNYATDVEPALLHAAWTILLDVHVAIPFVAMLGNVNDHAEAQRRVYYGQAGSHRIKPYGLEYRVLSSAVWLSPNLLYWVYGQAREISVHKHLMKGAKFTGPALEKAMARQLNVWNPHRIQHIINQHDVREAAMFVDEFKIKNGMYRRDFYDLMRRADAEGISIPTNLRQAWNLDNNIINHGYQGVESFMAGNRYKDQFMASMPKLYGLISNPGGWASTASRNMPCGNPNCAYC